MQVVWIIVAMLGAAGAALPLWLASRWLAGSWEVLDDDELSYKLSSRTQHSPTEWLRLRGWFAGKPRRLTYRRDERGRFRRVRR